MYSYIYNLIKSFAITFYDLGTPLEQIWVIHRFPRVKVCYLKRCKHVHIRKVYLIF
jgi:hypothetical protein